MTLSHVSPDGEQGFPGEMHIKVTYTLNDANELRLDYEATTDKPTVVTLTNHVYFNMAGNGSGDVYGQQLQVMADQYTPTDADQVPTGELASVAGTALDFRQLTPIGARVRSSEQQMLQARGYDHNFVLRKPAGDPMPLAVRMLDPVSGRLPEVRTTEPGVQVYSANHFNGTDGQRRRHHSSTGRWSCARDRALSEQPQRASFPVDAAAAGRGRCARVRCFISPRIRRRASSARGSCPRR